MLGKINIVIKQFIESLYSKSCTKMEGAVNAKIMDRLSKSRAIGQDHKLTSVAPVDCVQEYLT